MRPQEGADRDPRIPPLPDDAPLLSLSDVAAYLRRTVGAVRKLIEGRADSDDGALGEMLRGAVVKLSAHRTYVARKPFVDWLAQHVPVPPSEWPPRVKVDFDAKPGN